VLPGDITARYRALRELACRRPGVAGNEVIALWQMHSEPLATGVIQMSPL
jgi:hypothetical protein